MQGRFIKRWNGYICRDDGLTKVSTKNGYPKWVQWVHQNEGGTHCAVCLSLDGCLFLSEKAPKVHMLACHCRLVNIPYSMVLAEAKAIASYSKFDPYLFNTDGKREHGKEKMFFEWGYTAADSRWLQEEFERQGLEKYIKGGYKLGRLNAFGQRIDIRVTIPNRRSGGNVSFITGWMVKPDGTIWLNTPYGGK